MSLTNERSKIILESIQAVGGNISGVYSGHKFGANLSVGTSYVPIAHGGVYQTPKAITSLEILSSDVNDNSSGLGARSVRVIGLSTNYKELSEDVEMNGTTAVALTNQFYRVYRMYVLTSGTYATASASSHVGKITLQAAGGGAIWAVIENTDFSYGQTQIAVLTIPAGKRMFLGDISITIQNTKTADIILLQRTNIDTVVAPYSPLRMIEEYIGVVDTIVIPISGQLLGPYPEKTDIGFMGKVATGTGSLSVQFDYVLEDV